MGADAWGFDADRQALAWRLRSKRLRLQAIRTAANAILAAAFVLGGATGLRDAVSALRWPGWASLVTFLIVLFVVFSLAELPFSYLGGFRREREFGLSTQTGASWLRDVGKSLALGLASTVGVGYVLVLLLGLTSWWWLIAWILGVAVSLGLGFVAPIWLVPLFYRYRPIADETLRKQFEALAARAGVPVIGVFELGASAKTRRSNAAVMGFGRTRRILVTDTLLHDFAPEEIETILAHELAHQRHQDPGRGFLAGSVVSLAIVAITAWVYGMVYASFGVRAAGDMAGLPLLAVVFSLVALPFRPLELWRSRLRESWADRFSLELTRNPTAFASAMVRLHDQNLGVANPRPWEKWLFYGHPTGRERVASARRLDAAHA